MCMQVRQVPYRDKMDDEWELFQKSMKEETVVSMYCFLLPLLLSIFNQQVFTELLQIRPSPQDIQTCTPFNVTIFQVNLG